MLKFLSGGLFGCSALVSLLPVSCASLSGRPDLSRVSRYVVVEGSKPAPPPPPFAKRAELPIMPAKPSVPDRQIISGDVLFDSNKTVAATRAARILDRVAEFLKENPSRGADLYGHTDSVGDEKYNQRLSVRRAAAVRDYLVKNGVDSRRLMAGGFGETRPIADNRTKDGRAKNRRVEIKIREVMKSQAAVRRDAPRVKATLRMPSATDAEV